jgi:hypothetical protein
MFVIVGSPFDSAYDELYEIYNNTVETYVGPIAYGIEEELSEFYGKRLAKRILKAYEDGKVRKITGSEKIKILEAIDRYFEDYFGEKVTYYSEKVDELVVYELLV